MPEVRFEPGVVITAAAGRWDNLVRALACVDATGLDRVVVVFDGQDAWPAQSKIDWLEDRWIDVQTVDKYEPGRGMTQPRNHGESCLPSECTHVWFLDSDLVFEPSALEAYRLAYRRGPDRVLIGPYDWMAPGQTEVHGRLEQRDPRWASFDEHAPDDVLERDLGAALACFGGNLVWPRPAFQAIGGFHSGLFHGRCEDGELGLRACEAGIPMSFVRGARAFHVWHRRNIEWILAANERDVPLINEWHPWVEQSGLVPVAEDGCRFDFVCHECGLQMNTWYLWSHLESHVS